MSKKIMVLMGIVMCVVVSAGIFYWNAQNQEPEAIGSPSDYVVVESEPEQAEQGRYVENKKAGLKVRIPDGWTEEKMDVMEGSMVFYSPDAEGVYGGRLRPPLKGGCMIEVAVVYKKTDFEEIKREIKEIHKGLQMQLDEVKMIKIQNEISVLKNEFNGSFLGWGQAIYLISDGKLYNMGTLAGSEDIEKCSQEFDKFLENIVIE